VSIVSKKSIDIMLTNKENIFQEHQGVQFLGAVDEYTIDGLIQTAQEREKLSKRGQKLEAKRAKATRHARRLIERFAKSRQIQYDAKTQGIGISKDDVIYVGNRERLKADPTVDPQEDDIVKGKLTKTEKRLYEQSVKGYGYLSELINNYMNDLTATEIKLVSFEKNILKDKEYSVDNNYLIVSLIDGKVYLANHQVEEVVEERTEVESEQK
jgi:hypothetical protein